MNQDKNNYVDKDNPWKGILAVTEFCVCYTYHKNKQKPTVKLVLGQDLIIPIEHAAN